MVRRRAWAVVVAGIVAGLSGLGAIGPSTVAAVGVGGANPPDSERLVLRLSTGATWRGWVGEQVEVDFEEAGVMQRGRGLLRAATPQFIQVDMLLGSSRALRTILMSSLRGMRTLEASETEAPEALLPQPELDLRRWIVEDDHELTLIRLSAGVEAGVEQLGELESGVVGVVLVDVETIDAVATAALLAAVDAARVRGAYLVGLGGRSRTVQRWWCWHARCRCCSSARRCRPRTLAGPPTQGTPARSRRSRRDSRGMGGACSMNCSAATGTSAGAASADSRQTSAASAA
jgi:hypothetical protein